ncbi:MAG TPA: hypothetical protein VES38_02020 [Methylotenera sp.]|nr:hypothetical protein [Methylotenera sp.]
MHTLIIRKVNCCNVRSQAHAEIFKCKNDKGTISYQGTPCSIKTLGKLNKVPDAPIEEQIRAQERTDNIVEANRQKDAARELERLQRIESIKRYELEKKSEAQQRQAEAAERAAAAAERSAQAASARNPIHCRPDYVGGLYCN